MALLTNEQVAAVDGAFFGLMTGRGLAPRLAGLFSLGAILNSEAGGIFPTGITIGTTETLTESGGNQLVIAGGLGGISLGGLGAIAPSIDDNFNFGSTGLRWATMYTFGIQTYQSGADKVAVSIPQGAALDLNGAASGATSTAGLVYVSGSINTFPASVPFQAGGVFALDTNSIGMSVAASSGIGFQGQGTSKSGLYMQQSANGAVQVVGGSFQDAGQTLGVTTQAGTSYSAAATDHIIYMSGASVRTVTLPHAAPSGSEYTIVDSSGTVTSTNTITVNVATSGTVKSGGAATNVITPGTTGSLTCVSDGANYWITAKV
jgi:hypothetical protein